MKDNNHPLPYEKQDKRHFNVTGKKYTENSYRFAYFLHSSVLSKH